MTVSVLWLFLTVLWVALQCAIFPDHIYYFGSLQIYCSKVHPESLTFAHLEKQQTESNITTPSMIKFVKMANIKRFQNEGLHGLEDPGPLFLLPPPLRHLVPQIKGYHKGQLKLLLYAFKIHQFS